MAPSILFATDAIDFMSTLNDAVLTVPPAIVIEPVTFSVRPAATLVCVIPRDNFSWRGIPRSNRRRPSTFPRAGSRSAGNRRGRRQVLHRQLLRRVALNELEVDERRRHHDNDTRMTRLMSHRTRPRSFRLERSIGNIRRRVRFPLGAAVLDQDMPIETIRLDVEAGDHAAPALLFLPSSEHRCPS